MLSAELDISQDKRNFCINQHVMIGKKDTEQGHTFNAIHITDLGAQPVLADMPHANLLGCVHVSECATGKALSLGNIHPLAYITLMPELFAP